jgi:hypothetical protein
MRGRQESGRVEIWNWLRGWVGVWSRDFEEPKSGLRILPLFYFWALVDLVRNVVVEILLASSSDALRMTTWVVCWGETWGTQERLTDPPRRSKVRPLHSEAARCSGGRQDGGATVWVRGLG